MVLIFFFNEPPTPDIYTLSLHDALPIWTPAAPPARSRPAGSPRAPRARAARGARGERSEEHTSELQSRENLVCRLLLEKKKRVARDATGCPPFATIYSSIRPSG